MPKKICYILLEYNLQTDSHLLHIYKLLEKLSFEITLSLIVEKSPEKENKVLGTFEKIYFQKRKSIFLRYLENLYIILKMRFSGYRNFWVHYSYIGAINASIVTKIFGGKVYYWNCGMAWLFKKDWKNQLKLKLSLRLVDFLVTGNETLKNGYIKHYGIAAKKVLIFPNWVDNERFNPSLYDKNAARSESNIPKDKKIVLFVHWLSERKGAHYLIPIANILKQRSDILMLIIGRGLLEEKLKTEAKENALNNIEILGTVPNKEVVKYYAASDIFLMPSNEEGFPRVLVESMTMGIPYVASDVGGVREISPPAAQNFIIKPGDISGFAQKILLLLDNDALYKKFSEEALKKAKDYSLEKAVDRFVKLVV